MNKVAIYIRVSTQYQIDKDSLPMQRQDLIAYSKLILNTDDYVIFEDAGYSGKNTDRPKYQEMMSQVRQGTFTHILVWKIDRISRNLLDFATMYAELKELGVTFVSKNEQFDTSTAIGEAMLKIILVFAELERQMTSERVTATMISRASNGIWNGGKTPYGYNYNKETKEFSINEEEAAVVRLIHDSYEESKSLVRVATKLNEKGLRTHYDNEWSVASVFIILHNVFYCGDYRYNVLKEGNRQKKKSPNEWITVKDHHVPIISREQKDKVISILDNNSRLARNRVYVKGKHIHVFEGLLYCDRCGSLLQPTPGNVHADGWRSSAYRCKNKQTKKCNQKITSDVIIGEVIINIVLNIINLQKSFNTLMSLDEIQLHLLKGNSFSYVNNIEPEGLNEIYCILASGVHGPVWGKDIKRTKQKTELPSLKKEKQKIELALDRLRSLYLFSTEAMSESEYIIEREKLTSRLSDINDAIDILQSDSLATSLSDDDFISLASYFILNQNLADRNYVNYTRLAKSVDASVLQSFFSSIIDRVDLRDGMVTSITFRNGLSLKYIIKDST